MKNDVNLSMLLKRENRGDRQIFRVILMIGILTIFLSSFPGAAKPGKANKALEIMEKVESQNQSQDSQQISTMTLYNAKGQSRVRKIATISKLFDQGKTEKRLLRFLDPPDIKGTGLLIFDYEKKDDDMWIFLPALRKSRRIVSSEKSKRFMGSEFSYADISPPEVKDFNFKLLGSEKINGTNCWKIESKHKNEDISEQTGYSRRLLWVGQKDYVLRKVLFYDLDDELLKILNVSSVKEVNSKKHIFRAFKLEMDNQQNQRKSIIQIEKLELDQGVGGKYFTLKYLEKP